MDEQTALVLAFQLVALFSIAGALLLYLLYKIKGNETGSDSGETSPGAGKPVLVTCCDNAIGLQVAIHLANRGFRVFAGLKQGAASGESSDSSSARVIRAWQKQRESTSLLNQGTLVALPLDVNREDLLHESVDIIRAHLPAGKDGLWAVINTSGICYRGRVEQQDISHWETTLKINVVGLLRVARTYQTLLRSSNGRLLTIGSTDCEESGLVAYTASKYAVQGASNALRQELSNSGIKVITLNPNGIASEVMYATPKVCTTQDGNISVDLSGCLDYQPTALSTCGLQQIAVALSCSKPKPNYTLQRKKVWQPLRILNV